MGGLLANWRQPEILGKQVQMLFLQVMQMGITINQAQPNQVTAEAVMWAW